VSVLCILLGPEDQEEGTIAFERAPFSIYAAVIPKIDASMMLEEGMGVMEVSIPRVEYFLDRTETELARITFDDDTVCIYRRP